ncbi:LuxR C-terminal-related transcriptional regulator [Leifsonia sp. NPDC058292]|uniref:LuxR C-terminal-related transcriptional regulator n=1 Tax=Leifsonia sp. NPDC058292 TaxID=3346428 RepID=UPI0036D79B98
MAEGDFDLRSFRGHTVQRRRLHRVLDDAEADGRSTVTITAGAGWGKTTLLDQWCAEAERRPHTVIRVAAQQLVDANLSLEAALRSAFGGDATRAETATPVTIVIDDVHLIESHADRGVLQRLAGSLREHEMLILSGRSQPLGFLGLISRRSVTDLGQSQLAFTADETEQLLSGAGSGGHGSGSPGPAIDATSIAELLAHTRGWAYGLSLFAQVLTASDDPRSEVARFTGDPRPPADYLVAAFLAVLPEATQNSLLALSVVDDVTIPLAMHLTDCRDIGTLLESLSVNTTLVRRGRENHEGPRYTFDELLRATLLAEQRRRDARRLLNLHEAASAWLTENGEFAAGLDQAIRSESTDLTHRLLRLHGLGLVFSGAAPVVHSAIGMLEDRAVITGTTATLSALLAAPYQLDSVRLDHFIRLALEGFERYSVASQVVVDALLVMRAKEKETIQAALRTLEEAVARAESEPSGCANPSNMLDARLFAEAARAFGALNLGDFESALQIGARAVESAEESSRPWLALMLADIAGYAAARQGDWRQQLSLEHRVAARTAQNSTPRDIVSAHSAFLNAAAAYQSGEPYDVARLTDIVQTQWRFLDPGLSLPPRVLTLLFKLDGADNQRALYDEMERLLAVSLTRHPRTLATGSYRFIDLTLRFRGRSNARDAVAMLARALGQDAFEVRLANAHLHAGTAAQGAHELGLEAELRRGPLAWHGSNLVLGWLLLAGWAAESGRQELTLTRLQRALELGQLMNARRPFLAGGAAAARLVEERLGSFGVTEEFAESVVEAAHRLVSGVTKTSPDAGQLTPRERALLRELPLHQSVGDIARKHSVSPNTVKTHLRSIYQKLGAGDRTSAVENARRVGLL